MDRIDTFENEVSPNLQPHTLEVTVPPTGNRLRIENAVRRAADFFLIEIGLTETAEGYKPGVKDPRSLDEVAAYLAPEI